MTDRVLHIAAYDIAHRRRRREALELMKGYASGGQKSLFECFLSDGEQRAMLGRMRSIVDPDEDRFLLLRLDPRGVMLPMGTAVRPTDPPFYYVG